MIGAVLIMCAGCSSAPLPTVVSTPEQRVEHVQVPSKLDAQREMEYRQLKAALDKAQQANDRFNRLSTWGP